MKWKVSLDTRPSLRDVEVHGYNSDGVLVEVLSTRANIFSCRRMSRHMKFDKSTIVQFDCGKSLKDPRSIARHIVKCHRRLVAEYLQELDS